MTLPLATTDDLLPADFAQRYWHRRPTTFRWSEPFSLLIEDVIRFVGAAPDKALRFRSIYEPVTAPPPTTGLGKREVVIVSDLDLRLPQTRPWLCRLYSVLERAIGHFPGFEPAAFVESGGGGMEMHFDTGHIFSIQVEGTKEWSVFPASCVPPEVRSERERLPMEGGGRRVTDFYRQVDLPPAQRFRLEPGDVLYLPAFWLHQTYSPTRSLSVSVTAKAFSDAEWFSRALDGWFRSNSGSSYAMVPLPDPDPGSGLRPVPRAPDATALPWEDLFRGAWLEWQSCGWFRGSTQVPRPSAKDGRVRKAPGARILLDEPCPGALVAYVNGTRLKVPADLKQLLDLLSALKESSFAEIVDAARPLGHDPEVTRWAIELCLKAGYLEVVESSGGAE